MGKYVFEIEGITTAAYLVVEGKKVDFNPILHCPIVAWFSLIYKGMQNDIVGKKFATKIRNLFLKESLTTVILQPYV